MGFKKIYHAYQVKMKMQRVDRKRCEQKGNGVYNSLDGPFATFTSSSTILWNPELGSGFDNDMPGLHNTHRPSVIMDPDEFRESINDMNSSKPVQGHCRSLSAPSDFYLPPKVSGAPPSLDLLRPVSPFDVHFYADDDDRIESGPLDSNEDGVEQFDSGLGASLMTIVSDAANLNVKDPDQRDTYGNMSLLPAVRPPPVVRPDPGRQYKYHPNDPAFKGKKEARWAGRGTLKAANENDKKKKETGTPGWLSALTFRRD